MTGEEIREVNFTLPKGSEAILLKLEGFYDFSTATEALHCDKPGTGWVDAPRAFQVKLVGILT